MFRMPHPDSQNTSTKFQWIIILAGMLYLMAFVVASGVSKILGDLAGIFYTWSDIAWMALAMFVVVGWSKYKEFKQVQRAKEEFLDRNIAGSDNIKEAVEGMKEHLRQYDDPEEMKEALMDMQDQLKSALNSKQEPDGTRNQTIDLEYLGETKTILVKYKAPEGMTDKQAVMSILDETFDGMIIHAEPQKQEQEQRRTAE